MFVISSCFVATAMILLYLPVFYKLQLQSGYEYLKLRFDDRIRNIASTIFVLKTFLYVPIVVYIPALAFNQGTIKASCYYSIIIIYHYNSFRNKYTSHNTNSLFNLCFLHNNWRIKRCSMDRYFTVHSNNGHIINY